MDVTTIIDINVWSPNHQVIQILHTRFTLLSLHLQQARETVFCTYDVIWMQASLVHISTSSTSSHRLRFHPFPRPSFREVGHCFLPKK